MYASCQWTRTREGIHSDADGCFRSVNAWVFARWRGCGAALVTPGYAGRPLRGRVSWRRSPLHARAVSWESRSGWPLGPQRGSSRRAVAGLSLRRPVGAALSLGGPKGQPDHDTGRGGCLRHKRNAASPSTFDERNRCFLWEPLQRRTLWLANLRMRPCDDWASGKTAGTMKDKASFEIATLRVRR